MDLGSRTDPGWRISTTGTRFLAALPLIALCLGGCADADEDTASPPNQQPPAPQADDTPGGLPSPDSSIQDGVLADGQVTRAELEQSYAGLFRCFRDGGATGEAWLHLDLDSSYALRITMPGSGAAEPQGEDPASSLHAFCEASYIDRVQRAYAEQNPPTPQVIERRVHLAVGCLDEDLPDLAQRVDPSWDLQRIRDFAMEQTQGSANAAIAQACVQELGLPWRDIRDM